ncbi:MAG: sulfotransferase [Acidobacteria bacterium]|nr:sulfotransferase [Acidobacteriota bacterium]
MAEIKPRPIIILGVDRSGTSMVSEMVSRWGAYGGPDPTLSTGDEKNQRGYWEYEALRPLLDELLLCADVSEWHPMYRVELKKRSQETYYRKKAEDLIAPMEIPGKPWFWKDPDLCLMLSFWLELWKDPVFVITVRNPYDSAVSMEKFVLSDELRNKKYRLITAYLLRWQCFMVSILSELNRKPEKIFLQYEELMESPDVQAKRLFEFLNRACGASDDDHDRLQNMVQVVTPGLWRNRSPMPLERVPQASKEQKGLYQLLCQLTENPAEPYSVARYPMYAGWWEYLELVGYIT